METLIKKKMETIIKKLDLKPLDVIILKKKMGIFGHYAMYLGFHNGGHLFIANNTSGVQIIPEDIARKYLSIMSVNKIKRFKGNYKAAVQRLNMALKRKSNYNLFYNNCEHFVNYIWYGIPKSQQVEDFSKLGIVAGTVITLIPRLTPVGIVLTILSTAVYFNQKKR